MKTKPFDDLMKKRLTPEEIKEVEDDAYDIMMCIKCIKEQDKLSLIDRINFHL